MTHSVATLEVSPDTFSEIYHRLKAAGYERAFVKDHLGDVVMIDLTGIGLTRRLPPPDTTHALGDRPVESTMSRLLAATMGRLDMIFNGNTTGDKKIGLVLMTFPYGNAGGEVNYVSNGADRADISVLLRQQAARLGGQPELSGRA